MRSILCAAHQPASINLEALIVKIMVVVLLLVQLEGQGRD